MYKIYIYTCIYMYVYIYIQYTYKWIYICIYTLNLKTYQVHFLIVSSKCENSSCSSLARTVFFK